MPGLGILLEDLADGTPIFIKMSAIEQQEVRMPSHADLLKHAMCYVCIPLGS